MDTAKPIESPTTYGFQEVVNLSTPDFAPRVQNQDDLAPIQARRGRVGPMKITNRPTRASAGLVLPVFILAVAGAM